MVNFNVNKKIGNNNLPPKRLPQVLNKPENIIDIPDPIANFNVNKMSAIALKKLTWEQDNDEYMSADTIAAYYMGFKTSENKYPYISLWFADLDGKFECEYGDDDSGEEHIIKAFNTKKELEKFAIDTFGIKIKWTKDADTEFRNPSIPINKYFKKQLV